LVVGFDRVTAILVVHNGEPWLPSVLKSLADLDQRPGRLIAVDAGSVDASPQILREAMDTGVVARGTVVKDLISSIETTDADGYAAVVNKVAESLGGRQDGWIWLLHDDVAPRHGCLTELLRVATSPDAASGPAIVVPKLLRPKLRRRPDQVQSVGEAVSVSGARVVAAEIGDVDQHQDEPTRVLGASTAGLLIRRDAWRQLGGLSTHLPGFRAGVDLGWRANEAGLTVRTAPDASLRHQQAGLAGLREGGDDGMLNDRLAGLRVAVAHSQHPAMASWRARAINRVQWVGEWLAKDSEQAHVHSAVLRRFRAQPGETAALTAEVRAGTTHKVPRALLPSPVWGVRHSLDLMLQRVPVDDWSDGSINLDLLTGDDDIVTVPSPPRRGVLGLAAFVFLLAATLVAARNLLGAGALVSTGLVAAPRSLAAAWQSWLIPSGGQGANAPWLALMALGSTLAGGQPGLWAAIMVLGCVAAGVWSAYRFVRPYVDSTPLRFGLAFLWGVLFPVSGAASDGSPGWVMLAVAIPWLAGALLRWEREPMRGLVGLRAPAAVALTLATASCVTPALWVPGVVVAAIVAARQQDWKGLVLAALGPVALLGPWLPRLMTQPGRLLTGVDPALSLAVQTPSPWGVLVGRLNLGAATPLWIGCAVFGILWLLGLIGVGLVESPGWRRVVGGGFGLCLIVAIIMSRVVVDIDGQLVRAAALPWLLLSAIVAIGALAVGWTDALWRPRHENPLGSVVTALIAVSAVIGALWWLWGGLGGPMHRQGPVVPDYVTATELSPRDTRTLVVDIVDGRAGISVVDANGPTWGSGEQSPLRLDEPERAAVMSVGGQFADGFASDDLASRLGSLGIGHVIVLGASSAVTASMSGAPDMVGGSASGVTVWTVGGLPSRATLIDGDNTTPLSEGIVPPGPAGRVISIGERPSLPWRASVDGVPLQAADAAIHFTAPPAGGALHWWLPQLRWAAWWHLIVLVLLGWCAWPASGSAVRAAQTGARRAAA